MTQPFVFTLMDWIEAQCPSLGVPTPALEWLTPTGVSLAIRANSEPTVQKSYINGSREWRMGFDVLAQGAVKDRLPILTNLNTLTTLLLSLDNTEIGDDVKVRRAETTTPALEMQTDSLMLRYRMSVTMFYKD